MIKTNARSHAIDKSMHVIVKQPRTYYMRSLHLLNIEIELVHIIGPLGNSRLMNAKASRAGCTTKSWPNRYFRSVWGSEIPSYKVLPIECVDHALRSWIANKPKENPCPPIV